MPRTPGTPAAYSELLKPSLRVDSVVNIDLDWLRAQGVKGLIFDLDDTLVCAIEAHAAPNVCDWITLIREEFKVYIVSNNFSHERVHVAAIHLDLPFVSQARKPSRRFFRHALAEMQLHPHEVAIVGDQLFTDVLGGNRLGAVTILVDPLSEERKWHRKLMRTLESQMLRNTAYHKPHHPAREPAHGHHPQTPQPAHHPAMEPGTHHH